MSNGPYASVAESVVVDIPKPRKRGQIINNPGYYTLRNYLVDFLVNCSDAEDYKKRSSPVFVNPMETHKEKSTNAEGSTSEDPEPAKHLSAINT